MWRPKDPVHLSETAFSDIAGVLSGHARDGNAARRRPASVAKSANVTWLVLRWSLTEGAALYGYKEAVGA